MNLEPELLVSQPDLGPDEAAAAADAVTSLWVGMGPRTRAFEQALAEYLGARHVVATANCTSALHLALRILPRDDRDEVIVPSLTFTASVQAVLMAGFKPVFADVDSETLTVNVENAAARCTARTRALLPVHLTGTPCDLQALRTLARERDLSLIEDAAHAFGSCYRGQRIGASGEAVCFSFSSNKNITCGEGGALVTDCDRVAERARELRFLGISRDTWGRQSQIRPWDYEVRTAGFRCHMSDIHAGIGLEQLRRVELFAARRRAIAAAYDAALRGIPGITLVRRDLDQVVPNLYVIRVGGGRRDEVYHHLREARILCGVHYRPNHQQPAFVPYRSALPVTERLAGELLSLPLHTRLTDIDVGRVISHLKEALASTPQCAAVMGS